MTEDQPPRREDVLIWMGMDDLDGGFFAKGRRDAAGQLMIVTVGFYVEISPKDYASIRWARVPRPEE